MNYLDLLFDVDGVCANLLPEWIRLYNAAADDQLDWTTINTWGLHTHVKLGWETRVYELLKFEALYDRVEPIEGASMAVNLLRQLGHRVYFITSAPVPGQKLTWLIDHHFLTSSDFDRQFYMEVDRLAKYLAAGDVLVDDNAETVRSSRCRLAALFSQQYNLEERTTHRVSNWAGVLELVYRLSITPRSNWGWRAP